METLALSFFHLFFFFFFTLTTSKTTCNPSACLPTEPPVRFPFQLNSHQPDNCGYRGFSLSCNNNNQTILNLPSGDVIIKSISYSEQTALIDPQFCLPDRIKTFILTGTPFSNDDIQFHYTFFNCSSSLNIRSFLSVVPFSCLSGVNYSVFALPVEYDNQVPSNGSCRTISTIPIPAYNYRDSKQEIELRWSFPKCWSCEQLKHGTCQAKPNHPDETVCRSSSSISVSGNGKYGLVIELGLSVLLCVIIGLL